MQEIAIISRFVLRLAWFFFLCYLRFQIRQRVLYATDLVDKSAFACFVAVQDRADIINEDVGTVHKHSEVTLVYVRMPCDKIYDPVLHFFKVVEGLGTPKTRPVVLTGCIVMVALGTMKDRFALLLFVLS